MNIYLMGFMGSGKSSLGKKLATRMGRSFIDLDQAIEVRLNKTITDVFQEQGEAYFRQVETQVLSEVNSGKEAVIALGGGAPCSETNLNLIGIGGMSIYIKEKPTILFGRLRENKKSRPLISSLNDDELKLFINEKLADRERYYNRADFVFEKDKTSWSFFVAQIENYVK